MPQPFASDDKPREAIRTNKIVDVGQSLQD